MKALLVVLLVGCADRTEEARALTGGDPERGRLAIRHYGCGSCHEIDGVGTARATVGPPLDNIAKRSYLAGQLPNTPENLMRWIQQPQAVVPGNVMPQMNVSDADSRDIAAYLYTKR